MSKSVDIGELYEYQVRNKRFKLKPKQFDTLQMLNKSKFKPKSIEQVTKVYAASLTPKRKQKQIQLLNEGIKSADLYQEKGQFNHIVFNYKPNIVTPPMSYMTLDPRKRNRFLSQKGSVNNSIDEKRSVSRNEQSNNELKKIQIKTTQILNKYKQREKFFIQYINKLQNEIKRLRGQLNPNN